MNIQSSSLTSLVHAETDRTTTSNPRGPLNMKMTNDILFHLLMQENEKLLRAFICSLLHLRPAEILSVEVLNPIKFGQSLKDKKYELDLLVCLNNGIFLNLEMQVINRYDWPERTLCYTGRALNHLKSGDTYLDLKPVISIGILDYTLFPESPEFYATYELINIKNSNIFTDKLTIHVLDLTQIELATEEDKAYHLDYWASLFKATTWEDLHMLAAKSNIFKEASKTIFNFCHDDRVIKTISAREDELRTMNGLRKSRKELDAINKELDAANKELDAANKELDAANKELDAANKELDAANSENARLARENAELQARIAALEAAKNSP